MKQSIILFIFELFCLYTSSTAGNGGPAGYSGDIYEAYLSNINCGDDGEGISFGIDIPDINQWNIGDASDWELVGAAAGSTCRPTSFTSTTVQYGTFTAQQCAKDITTDQNNNIIAVLFEINVATSGGQVTFQYDHHYQITCRYNAIDDTLQASFLPLHSIYSDGSGTGDLSFSFVLFFSNGYEVEDQTIDLGSELYGLLTVDGGGFSTLDVHFLALTATSSEGNTWPLISFGCSDDPTIVTELTCDTDNDEQVDFLAFRFEGQSGISLVTFEIAAGVCLPEEPSNNCDLDCYACGMRGGDNRKRRSLDLQRAVETKYYLKAGPYKFGNVDKEKQKDADDVDEADSSTFPTYLIAILVVSGVVAIAIVSAVVVIVFRKRRGHATLQESSVTDESSTGPV